MMGLGIMLLLSMCWGAFCGITFSNPLQITLAALGGGLLISTVFNVAGFI